MASLNAYVNAVKRERPLLAKLVEDYGELNILDFSTELFKRSNLQKNIYRPEFIDLLELTFPDIPKDLILQFDNSLRKYPIVSTADHHSIINHPVYLNSNILFSLFAEEFSQNESPITVPPILSFSSLPLNNAAFLRGILLSNPDGEKRFFFFGAKQRHEIIYMVDKLSFSESEIDKWIDNNKERFSKEELNFIKNTLLDLVGNSDIKKGKSFLEQTQIFNKWLWEKVFPEINLSFFPIEKLTGTFFRKILIKNKSLPIYKFLFNFSLEKQDELFDGIYGAWTLSKLKDFLQGGGTAYFWGVNSEKRLIPLKRENGFLVSKDNNFKKVKWEPESLAKALSEKQIIPSMILIYFAMAHFGLYCSGAFNQIAYFTSIMSMYKKGLLEIKENGEAERVEKMLTNGAHAFLYFLFGESEKKVIPLCTFNILLQKGEIGSIKSILKQVTLKEAFNVTAPLIFPFIVDPKTRDKMNFSFEDVYLQLKGNVPQKMIIQKW